MNSLIGEHCVVIPLNYCENCLVVTNGGKSSLVVSSSTARSTRSLGGRRCSCLGGRHRLGQTTGGELHLCSSDPLPLCIVRLCLAEGVRIAT